MSAAVASDQMSGMVMRLSERIGKYRMEIQDDLLARSFLFLSFLVIHFETNPKGSILVIWIQEIEKVSSSESLKERRKTSQLNRIKKKGHR